MQQEDLLKLFSETVAGSSTIRRPIKSEHVDTLHPEGPVKKAWVQLKTQLRHHNSLKQFPSEAKALQGRHKGEVSNLAQPPRSYAYCSVNY